MRSFIYSLLLSLLPLTSLAADQCSRFPWRQGEPLSDAPFSPAYSEPVDLNISAFWNLITSVDFLLWVPKEKGLELAINESQDPELFKSKTSPISYDYKPAFKVSLGYVFDQDYWTPSVEYTRFYTTLNGHANHEKGFTALQPIWINDKQLMSRARSHWRLKFDVIDALLSRPYCFGENLTLYPKIGVRTFLMRQKYKLLYTTTFGFEDIRSYNSNHSWATGPLAICEARFLFDRGFRLQSHINGSLVYQKIKTRLRQTEYSDRSTLTQYLGDRIFQITPSLETSIGLGWTTNFADNRWHFDLYGGYDFFYIWNQNTMRKLNDYVSAGTQGDLGGLMLHGLTLSFLFAF